MSLPVCDGWTGVVQQGKSFSEVTFGEKLSLFAASLDAAAGCEVWYEVRA